MLNICIAYPNKNNYSETFIYNHIKYLQPKLQLTGGWRPYQNEQGKSIFKSPLTEPARIFIKRLTPFYDNFYTKNLTSYLKKNQPDAVLAEYGITGVSMLKACKTTQTPLVVHFHGFDASDKVTLQKYKKAYQDVFEYAKAICVVSNDMKKALINLGASENKLQLIPYGVNMEQFIPKPSSQKAFNIIAVGRFTPKKAPQLTIKAFSLVAQKFPQATLSMIGVGDLLQECKVLVKKLSLETKVLFLGIKKPKEVTSHLQSSSIFIQHSIVNPQNGDSEGTPNAILEASACALPVVSTFHAGIKDAVAHGETGFLVQEGDYEQMAHYICALLDKPDLAKAMGQAGREKMIREYNMPLQIAKLKKVIEA